MARDSLRICLLVCVKACGFSSHESVLVDPVAQFGCEIQERRLLVAAGWGLIAGDGGEWGRYVRRHRDPMFVPT